MAYDKIIPIRRRLDHCVDYVLNPEKTDLGQALAYIGNTDKTVTPDGRAVLETAINCRLETACQEMQETKRRWGKRDGVLGYHLIHSYAPGEVNPEQAHAIGVEFAQRLLQGRYEVVISTHLDHDHLHNHILFNSVSFMDGRKFRDNFRAYYGDIRGTSNAVSRRHGLSVIKPEGGGKSYAEWNAEKQGQPTIRSTIRRDIDAVIGQSFTYATFLVILRKSGYEVKVGANVKHTAVKPPGSARFIRLNSLGEGYTEDAIKQRLAQKCKADPQTRPQRTPPKQYTVHRGTIPRKRRKPRGFRALYLHYLYLLGGQRLRPSRRVLPMEMRCEVAKLHRYQRQFRLIQEYRIESAAQLSMLSGALQAEIDALTVRRKALYQQMRHGDDTTQEIEDINLSLRQLRSNLRICGQIEADIPHIREQLHAVCRQEKEDKQNEKPSQQKQGRRHEPWM